MGERKKAKTFSIRANPEAPEGERRIWFEMDGVEQDVTPENAERFARDLIIYATDVRLGRSTNKEEIRQYEIRAGRPDPFKS